LRPQFFKSIALIRWCSALALKEKGLRRNFIIGPAVSLGSALALKEKGLRLLVIRATPRCRACSALALKEKGLRRMPWSGFAPAGVQHWP